MKTFRPVPWQAVCARCATLFTYFRTTRPRMICALCMPLLKQEHNDLQNLWTQMRRAEARHNAIEAHAHV